MKTARTPWISLLDTRSKNAVSFAGLPDAPINRIAPRMAKQINKAVVYPTVLLLSYPSLSQQADYIQRYRYQKHRYDNEDNDY